MLLKNISLLWNLETFLWENRGYLIHLFFSFLGGHLSTHCFRYLGHLSIFFLNLYFFLFFLFLLLNNFCIAPCLFSATKLLRDSTRIWSIYLVDGKPNKHVFVFTPSVGVEHFWVDLGWRHIFMPTPSVGVVHMWVVCTWSWF